MSPEFGESEVEVLTVHFRHHTHGSGSPAARCSANGFGSGHNFFRRNPALPRFTVPPSGDYVKELHACWRDTRAFSHSTPDARHLAAMQDAAQVGLGRMPPFEPQCRVRDDFLSKAYDAAARMGRIGNSLFHLLLGLSCGRLRLSCRCRV